MASGMKQFYVGHPTMNGIPPRIGEGFEARTISEARMIAASTLALEGSHRFGYLCLITKDNKVTVHGSVRSDGYWSKFVMLNGCLPMDYGDWGWKPVKKL